MPLSQCRCDLYDLYDTPTAYKLHKSTGWERQDFYNSCTLILDHTLPCKLLRELLTYDTRQVEPVDVKIAIQFRDNSLPGCRRVSFYNAKWSIGY